LKTKFVSNCSVEDKRLWP